MNNKIKLILSFGDASPVFVFWIHQIAFTLSLLASPLYFFLQINFLNFMASGPEKNNFKVKF